MDQLKVRLQLGNVERDNDLIFPNEIGDPMQIGDLRSREFIRIMKLAGLPRIRLYDQRHTSATLLLSQGEHPKVVAERLGHARRRL